MTDAPHQCFTVGTTAYMRNFNPDKGPDVFAVRYGAPPVRNEDGSTTHSLIVPALIVSAYMSEPEKIANRVADLLNAHWDANTSLEACAAALQDAGLLVPADYHRIINRMMARERLREIMA